MSAHTRSLLSYLRRVTAPASPDAALLARWIHQRDQDAFAALMARHGPMVLGVCRRLLGDEQEAEDAFQAAFLVLARRAARLRRPEALAGFLYTVARRLARKARAAAKRRPAAQGAEQSPQPLDPQPQPLDVLSGRELLALIDDEIARLPEVYRLPSLLCLLQGRTIEEAARQLGWSIGSLRGRLTREREQLRRRLTRRGLELSVGAVALLAPAAVPGHLRAAALVQLSAPSAAVRTLAAGWTSALKWKTVCLGLVVLSAIGLGTGLSLLPAPFAENTAVTTATAPPQAKNEPRRDRYGDPLPSGAITRLGTLRHRVPGEIRSLAFGPDGKTVAVASYGGLFLFDAVSGKRLQKLSIPGNFVEQNILLAFSRDGKRLARRGGRSEGKQYKGVVFVWDLADKSEPRSYDAEHAIWIGWSTEGEPLAVCLEKDSLCLRELASGRSRRFECKDLRRLELYRSVTCADVPAGKTLAIADEKRQVHIWDTATGRQRCALSFKNVFIRALALSPDGRILASLTHDQNGGATVQLWDAVNGTTLRTLATDQKNLHTLAFAPDGKTLATSDWSNVCFWDVATGRERSRVRDWPILESSLAFSGDGKWLAAATQHSSSFQIWDVASSKPRHESSGHRCRPHGTAFTPDGRRIATGGGLDGTIYIWDAKSSKSLARVQRSKWVRDLAFSADGRSLFSTWTDDELWISDAASGGKLHVLKLEDPDRPDTRQSAIAMHLSDDGKRLVALSYYHPKTNGPGLRYQDMLITGWDTSTHKQLFRRRRPGMESWRALSPDGRVLAMCYPPLDLKGRDLAVIMGRPIEQRLRLEDAQSGEPLLTLPMRTDPPSPLAFSPDGRLLATYTWQRKPGAKTSTIQLWETATGSAVLTLPSATSRKAAFSPDGRLLALIVPAQELLIYDLSHGCELRRFRGFDAEVTYVAFSPDGRRLVSGLDDSTLLIWDMGAREKTENKLDAEGIAKAWADLASTDAPCAFQARWALAFAPEQALPLLRKHLHPAKAADPQRLHRLLADLDSEQFAVREKAQAEMEKLGDLAEPALRQTLANKPSLEMRRRVQTVLERLRGPVKQPELLQALRAVAVLEDIGTSEARRLLEGLTKGAAESRLTREAKASLQRLGRRHDR